MYFGLLTHKYTNAVSGIVIFRFIVVTYKNRMVSI